MPSQENGRSTRARCTPTCGSRRTRVPTPRWRSPPARSVSREKEVRLASGTTSGGSRPAKPEWEIYSLLPVRGTESHQAHATGRRLRPLEVELCVLGTERGRPRHAGEHRESVSRGSTFPGAELSRSRGLCHVSIVPMQTKSLTSISALLKAPKRVRTGSENHRAEGVKDG